MPITLTQTRLHAGQWQGVAEGTDQAPTIEVLHDAEPLANVTVAAVTGRKGEWQISVPIPAELLSDGVQTFVIRDADTGDRLTAFSITAGVPVEDDLRAEIDLLRLELELLKRAFRTHCADSGK